MEVRILRADGSIGKRVYKCDVPADMYSLRRKLKKPLIGIGQWKNNPEKFITILSLKTNIFFTKELLQDLILCMDAFQEEETDGTI